MINKICLYGPSGSGKSTIADYIVKKYGAELFKIADPLYKIQKCFYKMLEKDINGQDGELLQFIAYKIEKEKPGWLAQNFLDKIETTNKSLIINDDCRLNSYYYLKKNGFIFIRIYTKQDVILNRMRTDHISIDTNHSVEQGFEKFQPDHTVDNSGSIEESLLLTYKIIDSLISQKV